MITDNDEIFEDKPGSDSSSGETAKESPSVFRHRIPWRITERGSLSHDIPGLHEVKELLEDDDASCLAEEEDGVGCPLPSTPEDDHLLDCEMTEVLKAGVLSDEIDLGALAHNAAEQAEEFVRKVWEASWNQCHFRNLPQWLQDNDFLHAGHRPPLPSFYACFKSIFRIHTETGNIWTHLLGCVAFIGIAIFFLTRPPMEIHLEEKIVFGTFFAGAIICLGMSFAFHTVHCHSECVGKLFSKLDYCGIAMLIMGSFVPWLYYGFYCDYQPKLIYLSVVVVLGITSIVVSLWERFGEPNYRPLRAGVFMGFGLSGFQSHQIFHVLVIAAAFVHYHGITEMAMHRMTVGDCTNPSQVLAF
ncbi:hypothetical protein G9C98_001813 [Cotesia typhae]|uniref:Adiponectin receptor protein n=1 Tax=Cotesia typhae TaxID=2053667 RepID=A0A8J5R6L2_9HYME|nr:hypothetical protein G9C98_001813 [Cotesia typhae]